MREDLTTHMVDARGHHCPLPSLKLRRAVLAAPTGTTITLLATDPMARIDIPHLCTEMGWSFETVQHADICFRVWR